MITSTVPTTSVPRIELSAETIANIQALLASPYFAAVSGLIKYAGTKEAERAVAVLLGDVFAQYHVTDSELHYYVTHRAPA